MWVYLACVILQLSAYSNKLIPTPQVDNIYNSKKIATYDTAGYYDPCSDNSLF